MLWVSCVFGWRDRKTNSCVVHNKNYENLAKYQTRDEGVGKQVPWEAGLLNMTALDFLGFLLSPGIDL